MIPLNGEGAWTVGDPPIPYFKDKVAAFDYLVIYSHGSMGIATWTNRNPVFPDETTDWHWDIRPYHYVVEWAEIPKGWRKEDYAAK